MGATIAIMSIVVIMTLVGYFYIRGAMAEAETAEGSIGYLKFGVALPRKEDADANKNNSKSI